MAASVQCRPQERTLKMAMKEVDEDLAMFLEMRNRENVNDDVLHTERLDDPSDLGHDSSLMPNTAPTVTKDNGPADNWQNADYDKSDYDWLLTPHGIPLSPSLEVEQANSPEGHTKVSNAQPSTPKPKAANSLEESALLNNKSLHPPISTSVNSTTGNGRPSSSGGKKSNVSRPATPTRRPSLPANSKPARPSTPTSRATLPSTKTAAPPVRSSTPTSRTTTKAVAPPVRSSTPTRATARSSTPTARSSVAPPVRSLTPTRATARSSTPTARSSVAPPVRSSAPARATAHSSTPTGRSSVPASRSGSRSATPTRKFNNSSIATPAGQPSLGTKTSPTTLKSPVPPRGLSPTVKSRPAKPSEVPDFSLNCPNVKDLMTKRPSSASRVRPSAPSAQASSTDNRKLKQQLTSSSTVRASNGSMYNSGSAILSRSRGHSIGGDEVNPVIVGTKMVERVVNMRKLAPPKQNEHLSPDYSSRKCSFSQGNPGFGRSLSKKSLDMAIRHMDITRSVGGDLRPLATSGAVRSCFAKGKTASLTDSPLATSSNTSSEPSFSVNSNITNGREEDDIDMSSDRGHSTPTFCQQHHP